MFFCFLFIALPLAYGDICPGGSLTDEVRNAILQAHNNLRSTVARGAYAVGDILKPAASNMRELTWSCSLEQLAQVDANGCSKATSASGAGWTRYFEHAIGTLSDSQAGTDATDWWSSEFQKNGWASNVFAANSLDTIGEATQMVWANTDSIGCGITHCNSLVWLVADNAQVVCYYSPPGNVVGQDIYKTGATCSACPSGTKCASGTGLCAVSNETETHETSGPEAFGTGGPAGAPAGGCNFETSPLPPGEVTISI